ncbi:MAG: response regulator [Desulfobacterales bacterium]|nr:response regulator [Desulfobacterales bacterium]MBF0395811.1 response regulator [Desulfobacterales bacterium]
MGEKVLLIDDEKDFIETLAERMKNRGMKVSTSTSPIEALKKVENEDFDAVVLDLMMPEMDGIKALTAIREKNPQMQVILLTGHATIEKGIEAMKLGAADFLEKPIDIAKLSEKIKTAQAKKMILVEKGAEEKIKNILGGKGW